MHRLISAPVSEQHPVVTIGTLDMANVKIPDFKLEHALSTWSTSGGRLAAWDYIECVLNRSSILWLLTFAVS